MTQQETDPDLPMSVQKSLADAWVSSGLLQSGGTECSSVCMEHFEGGCNYLHYVHHSLASGRTTGRKQPHLATKGWIKDLLSMDPSIGKDPFSSSISLSHQEA